MKVLFLHNPTSGRGIPGKTLQYLKERLAEKFEEFTFVATESAGQFISLAQDACGKYDYLLVSGGDGSVHMALEAVAPYENKPVFGFFPTGTCNDTCKNYGINANLKRCLKIVLEGNVNSFDALKCGDGYASFAVAVGPLASIPYLTSKKGKRKLGAVAYYKDGFPRLFDTKMMHGEFTLDDGEKQSFDAPFIAVLNSSHVGGYKVNPKSDAQDGLLDVMYCQRRALPAVVRFFFHSKKVKVFHGKKVTISTNSDEDWDIDGERGPKGDMSIEVLPNFIRVLSPKR